MPQVTAALLSLFLIASAAPAWAADDPATPPAAAAGASMSQEMMIALARLQMTPEQAQQFGTVVRSITASQIDMAKSELRRDKPGVDRTIRKKTKRIIKRHDKDMKAFLSADQFAFYTGEVRDTLYDELTRPARPDEGARTQFESREGGGSGGGCTWC